MNPKAHCTNARRARQPCSCAGVPDTHAQFPNTTGLDSRCGRFNLQRRAQSLAPAAVVRKRSIALEQKEHAPVLHFAARVLNKFFSRAGAADILVKSSEW